MVQKSPGGTRVQLNSQGSKLLQLYRLRAGITQSNLARQVSLKSERMVRNWEGGFSLPSAGRLKEIIAFYLGLGVFTAGREYEEVQALWLAVKLQSDNSFTAGQVGLTAKQASPQAVQPANNSYPLFDKEWFQVLLRRSGQDQDENLPALSTARMVNLPRRVTTLVGREAELTAIRQILEQTGSRLLTLTGPGGIGKTSLAVELARRLNRGCQEVIFVALETISDQALVLPAIAATAGIVETKGLEPDLNRQLMARLALPDATLSNGTTPDFNLLVLDNFEQLLEAGSLVEWLLESCPGLKLLVTSRAPLEIPGEFIYPVKPLGFPAQEELDATGLEGERFSAIALFVQRAGQAQPGFELTAANTSDIARICSRLDGLPLAIELAASWINILSPRLLFERLQQPLHLLEGERGPARHQTLRQTLEWSYNLLEPAEQRLFRSLAVFVGGCELEAIEAVCEGDATSAYLILKPLKRLVDKNLLVAQPRGFDLAENNLNATRFKMLETIREYSRETLSSRGEPGEAENLRQRHAAYYLKLARQAATELRGPDQSGWLTRLESDKDNFRAALRWGVEQHQELAVEMAGYLAQYWDIRGYLSEGRGWLTLTLQSYPQPLIRRAIALNAAGNLAYKQADFQAAISLLKESLDIHRLLDNRPNLAFGLSNLGVILFHLEDYTQALDLYRESLVIKRSLGNPRSIAASLNNLGELLEKMGDYAGAQAAFEEGLSLQRQVGDKLNIAILLLNLGELACLQKELKVARSFLEQSLSLFTELADQLNLAEILERFGLITILEGQLEISARLFGAAQVVRTKLISPMSPAYQAIYEGPIKEARNRDKANVWQLAYQAGLQMSLTEAVSLASSSQPDVETKALTGQPANRPAIVKEAKGIAPRSPVVSELGSQFKKVLSSSEKSTLLNERELEILALLTAGYSNSQAAAELIVTVNTIKWHIKNIFNKLDVNSRTQAIKRAEDLGLVS